MALGGTSNLWHRAGLRQPSLTRMSPWIYPVALAAISLLVTILERQFPWRRQRQLRSGLASDVAYLVFNGHILGMLLHGIAVHRILPPLHEALEARGWVEPLYASVASDWPIYAQIPVLLFGLDLVQWCVHVLLHRVPVLWRFHQTHHSVVDGEMDWIVAFRFQWTEVVVYRAVQYLPLAYFGFAAEAVMFHAVFGTLVGHLNHANLRLDYGWGRYLFNNPRMHIHHHDYERSGKDTVNYGIIFSVWDWLFRTAYLPQEAPARIGFAGVEKMPRGFLAQVGWPLTGRLGSGAGARVAGSVIGVLILVLGAALAQPPPG